jgi:hypothetical protein
MLNYEYTIRYATGYTAPVFLTSALYGREWSASHAGLLHPGKRAFGTHMIEGWVGPGAGLDAVDE